MFVNPLYLLAPPALIIVSLPLTIFAGFTTLLALNLLLIRVVVVYFEVALGVIRSWIYPTPSSPKLKNPAPVRTPAEVQLRRRRSSIWSIASSQEAQIRRPFTLHKNESYVSLLGAGAPNRDYEGVGGWRNVDNEQDESIWLSMNSRLELPNLSERRRHHHRSLTGGSSRITMSPEATRMSPVQSRARTPSVPSLTDVTFGGEEYFGLQPHGRPVGETAGRENERRRKSVGNHSPPELRRTLYGTDDARRRSAGSQSSSSSSSPSKSGGKHNIFI